MEERMLQMLIRRYSVQAHPVLILDEQGTLLWQTQMELPQQLIDEVTHCCQNRNTAVQYFMLGETQHSCQLYHDTQEDFWIAELVPYQGITIRLDLDAMTTAVQAITTTCGELENLLDEQELYDAMDELNRIAVNNSRLYRSVYLQKELDRCYTNGRRTDIFSINMQMRTLFQKVRNILRVCAEVQLEDETSNVMLLGDADQFTIAMLSALVICYRDTAHYQNVVFRVGLEGGLVQCSVTVTPKAEPLPSDVYGMQKEETLHYDAETAMLQAFCQMHEGSWMMAEQADTGERSCRVTFQPSKEAGNVMLHSSKELSESRFYNKYELLLSRIRCQRFY